MPSVKFSMEEVADYAKIYSRKPVRVASATLTDLGVFKSETKLVRFEGVEAPKPSTNNFLSTEETDEEEQDD